MSVSNDLRRRVSEHKAGFADGFTKRYACKRLVWYEHTNDVNGAIIREKEIKGWRREKKFVLVNRMNPDWADLRETLFA